MCGPTYIQGQLGLQAITHPSADGFPGVRLLRFPGLPITPSIPARRRRRGGLRPTLRRHSRGVGGEEASAAQERRSELRRTRPRDLQQEGNQTNHDIPASLSEGCEKIPRLADARDERETLRLPDAVLQSAEGEGWERALARGARGGGTRAPSSWPPPGSLRRSGGFDPAAGQRVAPVHPEGSAPAAPWV